MKSFHRRLRAAAGAALISGLLLAGGLLTPQQAAAKQNEDKPTAEAHAVIADLIAKENAAAGQKDVDGTVAAMSPDFIETDSSGKSSSLTQIKMALSQLYTIGQTVNAVSTIQSVDLAGSLATVAITDHITITLNNAKTGNISTLVVEDKSQDTWAKSSAGWQEIRSKILSETTTLDGQPLPSS